MVFPVTTRPRVAGPKAETANQDRKGQITAPVENAVPAMTDREPANPDQSLQQTSGRSPSADEIFNLPGGRPREYGDPERSDGKDDGSSRSYRSYGSALPRGRLRAAPAYVRVTD